MRKLFLLSIILLLTLATKMSTSTESISDNEPQKLQETLAKAVEAFGGVDRLRAVQSLSISGTFRRSFPDQERSGEYEAYFLSPDRYKKIETADVAKETKVLLTQVLNKNDGWTETGVKSSGIQINLDKLGAHAQASSASARRQIRADLLRHVLALLLISPGAVEFQHGDQTGLYMKAADGFTAHVALDPATYLPVTMTYRGRPPMIAINPSTLANSPEAHDTDIVVRFSDYRTVDGIRLPSKLTAESNGKFIEEFEMKSVRLNPPDVRAIDFER